MLPLFRAVVKLSRTRLSGSLGCFVFCGCHITMNSVFEGPDLAYDRNQEVATAALKQLVRKENLVSVYLEGVRGSK